MQPLKQGARHLTPFWFRSSTPTPGGAYERCRCRHGWRRRHAVDRALREARQTVRALCRQIPHYRLHPLQLCQLQHLQHRRVDAIPPAFAQRAYWHRQAVGPGPGQRRRPAVAALSGRRRHADLVPRHGRRGLAELRLRARAARRPGCGVGRRPHLQDGLR